MRTYNESVLRMASEALSNYFGGSHSPWSMLTVNAPAISFIYEVDPDKVWYDAKYAFDLAINLGNEKNIHPTEAITQLFADEKGSI